MNANHHATARPCARSVREPPTVFVADEDPSARRSTEMLIAAAGWRARTFGSVEEFLACARVLGPSCLILSASLPDLSAAHVRKLIADRADMPIVFIANNADVRMAVRAIRAGATEFLLKPMAEEVLFAAIRCAIDRSRATLKEDARMRALRRRYSSLSTREREVMALLVDGRPHKQIGAALGISVITVKGHSGRVMRKMAAVSLPELVTVAMKLELTSPRMDLKVTPDERRNAHRMLEYRLLNVAPRRRGSLISTALGRHRGDDRHESHRDVATEQLDRGTHAHSVYRG
jgi:FixJ family two-component response regulator